MYYCNKISNGFYLTSEQYSKCLSTQPLRKSILLASLQFVLYIVYNFHTFLGAGRLYHLGNEVTGQPSNAAFAIISFCRETRIASFTHPYRNVTELKKCKCLNLYYKMAAQVLLFSEIHCANLLAQVQKNKARR